MSIKVYAFKTEFKGSGENTRAVDWVNIGPIGLIMNNTTWYRIKDIMPPDDPLERDATGEQMRVMLARWSIIEPQYKAWKSGHELPDAGTAITMWQGIQKEIIDVFIKSGVKTIEDVADLTEISFGKVNVPDIRKYVRQAKEFLSKKSGVDAAAELAEIKRKHEDTEAKLAAAMEMLDELTTKKGGKVKEAA